MKKQLMILWTLLLPLALLLGGCFSLQKVPTARLNQRGLYQNNSTWIAGAHLQNGDYVSFDQSATELRARHQLPSGYKGAVWTADTVYGLASSWEAIALATDRVVGYETKAYRHNDLWIQAAYMDDGDTIRFDFRDPNAYLGKNKPAYARKPVIIGDSLYGFVYARESLAIPVREIEALRIHRLDVLRTALLSASVGGVIYYVISNLRMDWAGKWYWAG